MDGKGITSARTTLFVVATVVSAAVGWGVIEGFLWIISHISIGLV